MKPWDDGPTSLRPLPFLPLPLPSSRCSLPLTSLLALASLLHSLQPLQRFACESGAGWPDALEEDQLARILRDGALAIRHQAVMSREWADDPHHHRAVAVLRCGERGCDVETTSFECAVQHFGSRRHGKRPTPRIAQEVLNAIHRACRA